MEGHRRRVAAGRGVECARRHHRAALQRALVRRRYAVVRLSVLHRAEAAGRRTAARCRRMGCGIAPERAERARQSGDDRAREDSPNRLAQENAISRRSDSVRGRRRALGPVLRTRRRSGTPRAGAAGAQTAARPIAEGCAGRRFPRRFPDREPVLLADGHTARGDRLGADRRRRDVERCGLDRDVQRSGGVAQGAPKEADRSSIPTR